MPPTADRNDHPFKYHFGETHSEIDTFQPICSLNRNLKPKKHLIEPNWKELELATDDEQRDFLLKYLKDGKFEDRPVSCATTVLRPGDHLFCQGSLLGRSYEHHFLCVNVKRYGIDVIEYNGRSGTSASLASNPKAIAEIQRNYKTFEDLKKEKVKKRIWPKELQRFDNWKVALRACVRRNGEGRMRFHLLTNNCECFVIWCKCGLNTSLQVTPSDKINLRIASLYIKALRSALLPVLSQESDANYDAEMKQHLSGLEFKVKNSIKEIELSHRLAVFLEDAGFDLNMISMIY